jgi:hypothetical protein
MDPTSLESNIVEAKNPKTESTELPKPSVKFWIEPTEQQQTNSPTFTEEVVPLEETVTTTFR